MSSFKVLIITYACYPAPGGAANYSQTLARLLAEHGVAESVHVFTERYPGTKKKETEASGKVVVHRKMPRRATRDRKDLWSGACYCAQLLQIAALMLCRHRRFDVIMLHGALIYRTAFLARVVVVLKRLLRPKAAFILDVRDPLLPARRARLLKWFDGIVACSLNVAQDLSAKGMPSRKIWQIPIPLAPQAATREAPISLIEQLGLDDEKFVLACHGFNPKKRTEEIVQAMSCLRNEGYKLTLVVAGKARYWPGIAEQGQQEGWLKFVGCVPNEVIRALLAKCRLHVNVCAQEGLPRSSLEALQAGALTILPPAVAEFQRYCPDCVGTAGNPQILAKEIKAMLQQGKPASYPLQSHSLGEVARLYHDLFRDTLAASHNN